LAVSISNDKYLLKEAQPSQNNCAIIYVITMHTSHADKAGYSDWCSSVCVPQLKT